MQHFDGSIGYTVLLNSTYQHAAANVSSASCFHPSGGPVNTYEFGTDTSRACTILSLAMEQQQQVGLVKHVILTKFKPGLAEESNAMLPAAFESLPAKIPALKGFEYVEGLQQGFTHGFSLTFDSPLDRDTYFHHPDHQAYSKLVMPTIQKILVVDYHPIVVSRPDPAMAENKGVLKHILLAKFKPELSNDQVSALVAGYEALPSKISAMKGFEWGTDVSIEGLAGGFTHVFCSTFESPEGRDAYLRHPEHQEYAKGLLDGLEKVVVLDYHPKIVCSPPPRE